jgi:hypothetical protein
VKQALATGPAGWPFPLYLALFILPAVKADSAKCASVMG